MATVDPRMFREPRPDRFGWFVLARVLFFAWGMSAWVAMVGGIVGALVVANHPESQSPAGWLAVFGLWGWFIAWTAATNLIKPHVVNAVCRPASPTAAGDNYQQSLVPSIASLSPATGGFSLCVCVTGWVMFVVGIYKFLRR